MRRRLVVFLAAMAVMVAMFMMTVVIGVIMTAMKYGFTFYVLASEEENNENPYLVLVNKDHELPEDWEDKVQIDVVANALGEKSRIEHETCGAFLSLRKELMDQGLQIELDSVYRSVEEQEDLWAEWSADPELGEDYCKKYLAVPGFSEHHTGLAIDIFLIKDDKIIRDNDEMIADVEDFALIHEMLPSYGFILRYPEGKEDVTGYAYEPWHIRYVGDPEIAKEITESNLTLEEYLEK